MLAGVGNSTWDVAMNVEGADVERRLGRTIMPRFHAGFSLGTVLGAGLGAGAAASGLPVSAQLFLTAALTADRDDRDRPPFPAAGTPLPAGEKPAMSVAAGLARAADPPDRPDHARVSASPRARPTTGWRSAWSTAIDASETVGAIGFGIVRHGDDAGPAVRRLAIERWGRVAVLRVTAVSAAAGLLLVVAGIGVPLALVGALLWGAGASLGFPIGMSAAADDPVRAAIRVSVAGSIGYGAFLAGPPLIGLLAEHFGVLNAILCVFAALAIGLIASGAAKPLPVAEPAPDSPP